MDILATIITACGGAAVTGIFALIASNRARQKERDDADREIVRKLDALSKKLDKHIEEDTNRWADNARSRALAFGDEVRRHIPHTKEAWDDVLRDIDQYEDFCAGHPNYENNRAAATISHLKKVYKDHIRNNDFLI